MGVNLWGNTGSGYLPTQMTSATLHQWYRSDLSTTVATSPRTAGTAPPAITFGGTRTVADQIHITVSTTGAPGTARVNVTLNGTQVLTNQITTAGSVAIPGSTVTIVFPGAGAYSANNTWDSTANPLTDLSGNGYDTSNTVSTQNPLVVNPSLVPPYPGWRYDGVQNYNRANPAGIGTAFSGVNVPMHAFGVDRLIPGASNTDVFCYGHSTSATERFELQSSTTAWTVRRFTGAGNNLALTSALAPINGIFIWEWRFDGMNSRLYINGYKAIDANHASPNAVTVDQFALGAQWTSAGTFAGFENGDKTEFFIFEGNLSNAERGRAYIYLAGHVPPTF